MSLSSYLRLYRKKKKSLSRGEIELHIIRFLCDRDLVSIDVGANKGNYTLEMSKHSKKVLCFEPNSGFNKYLRKMPSNCKIINSAVTTSTDLTYLHAPIIEGDPKHNMAFISSNKDVKESLCISEVETVTLDEYLSEEIGMIKIDVEGAEMDVLNSCPKIIEKYSPNFLVESLSKKELGEQINFFKLYGYTGLKIINEKIYFVKDQEIFEKCREVDRNTIFIPSNIPA